MTTTFHRHWRDVPESAWRWPNFSPAEIACRGTGKLLVNAPAAGQAADRPLGISQPRAQPRQCEVNRVRFASRPVSSSEVSESESVLGHQNVEVVPVPRF